MKIVKKITIKELKEMATKMFGELVKVDVDITQERVIIDMQMHYDGEQELLETGSKQRDLWGINLYPEEYGTDDFIEYDSMINIRPSQGNSSRDVLDLEVREKIKQIIAEVVYE